MQPLAAVCGGWVCVIGPIYSCGSPDPSVRPGEIGRRIRRRMCTSGSGIWPWSRCHTPLVTLWLRSHWCHAKHSRRSLGRRGSQAAMLQRAAARARESGRSLWNQAVTSHAACDRMGFVLPTTWRGSVQAQARGRGRIGRSRAVCMEHLTASAFRVTWTTRGRAFRRRAASPIGRRGARADAIQRPAICCRRSAHGWPPFLPSFNPLPSKRNGTMPVLLLCLCCGAHWA